MFWKTSGSLLVQVSQDRDGEHHVLYEFNCIYEPPSTNVLRLFHSATMPVLAMH